MAISTVIVDYGMGNLRSVQKACQTVGHEAEITSDPAALAAAERLILPGVGAFADGMDQLRRRGQVDVIREHAEADKPMLGICLGMQLLFESSTEGVSEQPVPGLGLLPGRVVRFQEDRGPGEARLKVPHMGWNKVDSRADSALFADLPDEPFVYFVHGYYCIPAEAADVSGVCEYGDVFCAAAERGRLWAAQFHPEKSQRVGLAILKNFLERC